MEVQPDFRELLALLNAHHGIDVFRIAQKHSVRMKRAAGGTKTLANIKALSPRSQRSRERGVRDGLPSLEEDGLVSPLAQLPKVHGR